MCNVKRFFGKCVCVGVGGGFFVLVGFFTSKTIYGCFGSLGVLGSQGLFIAYFGNDAVLLPVYRAGQKNVKESGAG